MMMRAFEVSKTALLCLLLGSWLSGCERDKAPAAQDPAPTSTTQPLTTKLPKDWPSHVPTYPGAKVMPALKNKGTDLLVQRTNDPPAKVLDFYKAQLSSMHLASSVDKGALQSLTWSDDAQPPLWVRLSVGSSAGAKDTFVNLRVSHAAIGDVADVAPAAGQAGAAAQ